MATIERLKKRPDFLAAAEGRRFHTERMSAQGRLRTTDGQPGLRLGFTITKRVGHATERNRIRRRLREVVRLADAARLQAGHDYVVVGRRPALTLPFARIAQDFDGALRRLHAGRQGEPHG